MTHPHDPHADPPPPRRGPLPKPPVPATGPSGLSDYAVSPLGMRSALLGQLLGG